MVCSKKKEASEGEEKTSMRQSSIRQHKQGHLKGGNLLPFSDVCMSPAGLWQLQPAPSPA